MHHSQVWFKCYSSWYCGNHAMSAVLHLICMLLVNMLLPAMSRSFYVLCMTSGHCILMSCIILTTTAYVVYARVQLYDLLLLFSSACNHIARKRSVVLQCAWHRPLCPVLSLGCFGMVQNPCSFKNLPYSYKPDTVLIAMLCRTCSTHCCVLRM